MILQAAKLLNITRQTLYKWIQEDEQLQDAILDAREGVLDIAETKLLENVKEGKEASVFFLLKTLGKKRGFIEKSESEVTVKQTEPITIVYNGEKLDISK